MIFVVCSISDYQAKLMEALLCFDSTALLARVKSVEADVEKLTSGNTMLQMYIDNLTVQMAKRR